MVVHLQETTGLKVNLYEQIHFSAFDFTLFYNV